MDRQGAERQGAEKPQMWGARLRRRGSRPPRRFVAFSIGLHVVVVAGLYAAGLRPTRLPEFETFRVNLISPPPTVAGDPEPVETTTPVVPPVEPTPPPEPTPTPPRPDPPPQTQAPTPQPPERRPDPPPARGADPVPAPVGGEDMRVVQDGRDFQYPEYLNNIIVQLTRHFRPPEGTANLEVELVFYINRDGSVGGLRIVRSSGNFSFNAQAMAAVEQVGRARALGPLPDGWQRDRLYISYTFERPR